MKERMVTRTIKENVVHFMVVNTEKNTVENDIMFIPVSIKEKDWTEYANAHKNDAKYIYVSVKDYTTQETLYGLLEADFIKYATILPPRNGEETEE